MAIVRKRDAGETARVDVFDRFDRLFDEWVRSMPLRRSGVALSDWAAGDVIRVDELVDGDHLVIRAELPGIDPAEDVEVTVADGVLRIEAERREEESVEESGYLRRELRTGSFTRTLPLPEGASETDITASYKDGILEVRVPMPAPQPATVATIPIST